MNVSNILIITEVTAIETTHWTNTHDSFETVGKCVLDVEVMTQVRTVSIQYEVLKTKFLHK